MSKYTPTINEVREYIARVQGAGGSLAQAQAEAIGLWFDRWLAEHDREVKAEAWDEGARWGAVKFQSLGGQIRDESQVNLVVGDNPYREVIRDFVNAEVTNG